MRRKACGGVPVRELGDLFWWGVEVAKGGLAHRAWALLGGARLPQELV